MLNRWTARDKHILTGLQICFYEFIQSEIYLWQPQWNSHPMVEPFWLNWAPSTPGGGPTLGQRIVALVWEIISKQHSATLQKRCCLDQESTCKEHAPHPVPEPGFGQLKPCTWWVVPCWASEWSTIVTTGTSFLLMLRHGNLPCWGSKRRALLLGGPPAYLGSDWPPWISWKWCYYITATHFWVPHLPWAFSYSSFWQQNPCWGWGCLSPPLQKCFALRPAALKAGPVLPETPESHCQLLQTTPT